MVLQNSSDATEGETFTENPPASDDDPYSSSTTQSVSSTYNISGATLPQPAPIFGPLLGYGQDRFVKFYTMRIEQHAQMLKRPPTQLEAEAIAYWAAKQFSITSYGGPAGILAGMWRAHNTHATLRFPFWQPSLEKFHPELFVNERFAVLRGNRAVMAWHFLRYTIYAAVGKNISDILFGSYAMTVAAVGEMGDMRLKALREAAEHRTQQKRGAVQGQRMPGTAGSPQGRTTGQGNATPVDDASPSGGMFQEESNEFAMDSYNTGDTPQTSEKPAVSPNRWPQRSRQAPTPTPAPKQQASTQDDPFFTFDEASPTGGTGTRADTSSQQSQRQGSAWDRLRRSGEGTAASRQRDAAQAQQESGGWAGIREQGQSPSSSDDAFSKGDEYRSRAQSQAQQEFDARVERERRGGDFNTGNGDQKRW